MQRQVASGKRQLPSGSSLHAIKMSTAHATWLRVKVGVPFLRPGRISCVWKKGKGKGAAKICNSCNFHGKFATPRELGEQRTGQGQHNIFMCIRICALNVKMFVCLAFQALNFCCQRSSQKRVSISVYISSEQQRYFWGFPHSMFFRFRANSPTESKLICLARGPQWLCLAGKLDGCVCVFVFVWVCLKCQSPRLYTCEITAYVRHRPDWDGFYICT